MTGDVPPTEQATLPAFYAAAATDGGTHVLDASAWDPGADGDGWRCGGCGAHVSQDFHRVWSDNDGNLPACPECASRTERYSNDPVIDPGG